MRVPITFTAFKIPFMGFIQVSKGAIIALNVLAILPKAPSLPNAAPIEALNFLKVSIGCLRASASKKPRALKLSTFTNLKKPFVIFSKVPNILSIEVKNSFLNFPNELPSSIAGKVKNLVIFVEKLFFKLETPFTISSPI